jgi:hypothetical protein
VNRFSSQSFVRALRTANPILLAVTAIGTLLMFSSLYVPAIAAILGFMPPTLPNLLLVVSGGILSFAWFDFLKARHAEGPAGL